MITLVSPSKCIEQVLSLLFGISHMQFDEDHETVRELLVHLIERIYFEKGVRPASDPQNVLHYFLFNFTNYTKDSPDYKQFLADAESYAFIRGVETTDHFVNSFFLFLRCHFSQEELDKCFPKVPVRCVLIKHDLDIRLEDEDEGGRPYVAKVLSVKEFFTELAQKPAPSISGEKVRTLPSILEDMLCYIYNGAAYNGTGNQFRASLLDKDISTLLEDWVECVHDTFELDIGNTEDIDFYTYLFEVIIFNLLVEPKGIGNLARTLAENSFHDLAKAKSETETYARKVFAFILCKIVSVINTFEAYDLKTQLLTAFSSNPTLRELLDKLGYELIVDAVKDHSLISIENLSLIELPKSKVKNKETKVEKTKKESEKKEMAGPVNNTPAKRGTGRATAAKALQAGKHALAVNLATTGADALVVATRKALGTHYPDFLNTPLGKALEPWLVAVLLHFAASEFPQMPGADKVQAIAGLAIEGGTNRMMDPLFQMLRPVFESVANLPEAKSLVIDVAQAVQPEA